MTDKPEKKQDPHPVQAAGEPQDPVKKLLDDANEVASEVLDTIVTDGGAVLRKVLPGHEKYNAVMEIINIIEAQVKDRDVRNVINALSVCIARGLVLANQEYPCSNLGLVMDTIHANVHSTMEEMGMAPPTDDMGDPPTDTRQ